MSSLFGGGSDSQTVTQKSDPWIGAQPFLRDIFSLAQQQYGGFTPTPFPGQTFAPMDPLQEQAQRMAMQYATGSSELPPMQLPANMPEQAPTIAPQGSFPLYEQDQPVPSGSPGAPFSPPQQQQQQTPFDLRNFRMPFGGFGLPF